jgi:hypothetical protein
MPQWPLNGLAFMQQQTLIAGDGSQYIGKRLLVGITYEDQDGKMIRQEQFHGLIVEAGERGVVIELNDTGERKSLPPQLMEAPPGEYRLRSTCEVVINPDYLAKWVIKKKAAGDDDGSAT